MCNPTVKGCVIQSVAQEDPLDMASLDKCLGAYCIDVGIKQPCH